VSKRRQDYLRRLGIQNDSEKVACQNSMRKSHGMKARLESTHGSEGSPRRFQNSNSLPVASEGRADFRNAFLQRMSHEKVWIPKAQRPPKHQNVIIFEWDDTLLCTSFLKSCPALSESWTALSGSSAFPEHDLRRIEAAAKKLLEMAMRMGHTYVITNAESGWVEYSAAKYVPDLLPVLQKVPVISAHERYAGMFPNEPSKWKTHAFLEVQRQLDSQVITNLISLGSSDSDMEAAHVMAKEFAQAIVKTVKFPESPSPQALIDKLQLVSQTFHRTVDGMNQTAKSTLRLLSGDEVTIADCQPGDSVGDVLLRLKLIRPPPSKSHYVLVHAGQTLHDEEILRADMLSHLAALLLADATKDDSVADINDDINGDSDGFDEVDDGGRYCDNSATTSEKGGDSVRDTEGNAGTEASPTSALSSYLLACAHGEPPAELPAGYSSGHGCLGDTRSGVLVRSPPIQLTPRSINDIVLYHYTDQAGFSAITGQKDVKHLRASYAERAHFGDGIYASQFPPDIFASKEHILRNNYTNSSEPDKVESQLKHWRQKGAADYCVPIAVSREVAVNVSIEKTKEMIHPGCTLQHGPMRQDRDIWVVVISTDGKVTHGFEDLDAVYKRLGSSDFSMRVDAVEILAGHAARGDARASKFVMESLHDEDFNVRIAAIWAVVGTSLHSAAEKAAAITELAQHEPISAVLDAVKDALSFVEAHEASHS